MSLNAGRNHAETARVARDARSDDIGPPRVALTEQQIGDAGITLAQAKGGALRRHFLAPGSLIPDADRIARVSVRVLATVSDLRKKLGDSVEQGEELAVVVPSGLPVRPS